MKKQDLEEILDRIHEECGSEDGLTGHGAFVANLARRVFAGEQVDVDVDSGLELFGLEQFIN